MHAISKVLYNLVNGVDTAMNIVDMDSIRETVRLVQITNKESYLLSTSRYYKLSSKEVYDGISYVTNELQTKLFIAAIVCSELNDENMTLQEMKTNPFINANESNVKEFYDYVSSMLNLNNQELDMWVRSSYNGQLNLLLSKELVDTIDIPSQFAYLDIESKMHDIKSRLFTIKRLHLQMDSSKDRVEYQKSFDELEKYISEDKGYAKTMSK